MDHQKVYWDMIDRAHYYTWCALRGHRLPGNDPINGAPRQPRASNWPFQSDSKGESLAAYKAMAVYWINRASSYRGKYGIQS